MPILKNIVIIYHSPCPDGFAAAYAAWCKFGDSASYIPASHGKNLELDLKDKEVYMLDFSLSRAQLCAIHAQAKSFVVLDHHKTAQEALADLSFAHFDMHRSGAGMAWDFFHRGTPRPSLINFVEDRDLFVWRYGTETEYFTSHLDTLANDFALWHMVAQLDSQPEQLAKFIRDGAQMSRKFQWAAQLIADLSESIEFHGYPTKRVNAPALFTTDTGALLYKENQALALIWRIESGLLYVSLRSAKEVDAGAIAKLYGGGGHKNAAAFKMDLKEPATLLFMQQHLLN
jgi:oligoribonuclease NrnB/cAMP/cGMP phosphodiesterase (DHH superfamily)